jgi:hypothetical protein
MYSVSNQHRNVPLTAGAGFQQCNLVHKAGEMLKQQFKEEVEKYLTGASAQSKRS